MTGICGWVGDLSSEQTSKTILERMAKYATVQPSQVDHRKLAPSASLCVTGTRDRANFHASDESDGKCSLKTTFHIDQCPSIFFTAIAGILSNPPTRGVISIPLNNRVPPGDRSSSLFSRA